MTQPLTIGNSNELEFGSTFDSWGHMKVWVRVYSGEVEIVLISKADAIALVDHLSTVYDLKED